VTKLEPRVGDPDTGRSSSARLADLRFLLPVTAERIFLGDGLQSWAAAYERAGVEVLDSDDSEGLYARVAVTTAEGLGDEIDKAAETLLAVGTNGRRLRSAGYRTLVALTRPTPGAPRLVLPTADRLVRRYAFGPWSAPARRIHRVRNAVLGRLPGAVLAAGHNLVTLATRSEAPLVPFLVQAAIDAGVPGATRWFLALGDGDDLQRGVFYLFADGARSPGWVVKFSRLVRLDDPFAADEAGLNMARQAGPITSAHATRLVARVNVGTIRGAVETAAVGSRLYDVVLRRGPRSLPLVESIAEWVCAIGEESTTSCEELLPELDRLRERISHNWPSLTGRNPIELIPAVGGVLAHNDLGTWNIVVQDDVFTVIDWESARRPTLALWDLLYFLTDALVMFEVGPGRSGYLRRALKLLGGELPESEILFRWLRRGAKSAGIPIEAVGPVATACWLHHASSPALRAAAGAEPGAELTSGVLSSVAQPWLEDPRLGVDWPAWRDWEDQVTSRTER
jgi:hypothetical protein